MPPAISDDEESNVDVDEIATAPAPKRNASKRKQQKNYVEDIDDPENNEDILIVEEEGEKSDTDEGPDNSEVEPDVFIVEAIKSHLIDDDGTLRFHVKWQGYEKRSDMTWEAESNLMESASDIVNEYLDTVGGRNSVVNGGSKKDNKKKRGRQSSGVPTPTSTTNGKKRRSESHRMSDSPPASYKREFKPPTGSWEEDVQGIDACEGSDGKVMVFLSWANGHKTQHPLEQVYKRCPQKMLKFYESHLVFKKVEPKPEIDDE